MRRRGVWWTIVGGFSAALGICLGARCTGLPQAGHPCGQILAGREQGVDCGEVVGRVEAGPGRDAAMAELGRAAQDRRLGAAETWVRCLSEATQAIRFCCP